MTEKSKFVPVLHPELLLYDKRSFTVDFMARQNHNEILNMFKIVVSSWQYWVQKSPECEQAFRFNEKNNTLNMTRKSEN